MTQLKTSLTQIFPNIWSWSIFSHEKQMNFNGHAVKVANELAVIDPPLASPDILAALAALGQTSAVILTNRDHERESQQFRSYFNIPIAIHQLDAPLLTVSPDISLNDNQCFMDAFEVIHLPNQKSPGECGLYMRETGILILGDALIGKPAGSLAMLPSDKYLNPQAAKQSLKRLLSLEFDTLLLGDGDSILSNAHQAVENFFAQGTA